MQMQCSIADGGALFRNGWPCASGGHMVEFTRMGFVAFSVEKVRTVRNGCQRRTSGKSHKKTRRRRRTGEDVFTGTPWLRVTVLQQSDNPKQRAIFCPWDSKAVRSGKASYG